MKKIVLNLEWKKWQTMICLSIGFQIMCWFDVWSCSVCDTSYSASFAAVMHIFWGIAFMALSIWMLVWALGLMLQE